MRKKKKTICIAIPAVILIIITLTVILVKNKNNSETIESLLEVISDRENSVVNINDDSSMSSSEMTIEELATLIGYTSVKKISLGTFGELLESAGVDSNIIEIILKADIYRNKNLVDTQNFHAGDVVPLKPEESIIVGRFHLSKSFIEEDKEIFFSYIVEEKDSIPGYKLRWRIDNSMDDKKVEVPELNQNYVWYTAVPDIRNIKEKQNDMKKVPYFYARAVKTELASDHRNPAFELSEIAEAANCFNVFVVFSYEISYY